MPAPAVAPAEVQDQAVHDPALQNLLQRVRQTGFFSVDDVPLISALYFQHGAAPGSPWDALAHAHMHLPSWFQAGLDPFSSDYAAQQLRLWQAVAGVDRAYLPASDEREAPLPPFDAVRQPGYYMRRDPAAITSAADHIIATGMLLKHCGLQPGDTALEYGAGFGQTALALARLGVQVDTVDISATLCACVNEQARFFQVPLQAFEGQFGWNPRPGKQYKLILFYESFHHCLDFQAVLPLLSAMLAPGGRILLGGEPVVERPYAAVAYPWGLRLHSEVVAIVRRFRWFELGFSELFLQDLFTRHGFSMHRIDCEPSLFGRLYVAQHRPAEIDLSSQWWPVASNTQADCQGTGRWFSGRLCLPLDTDARVTAIELGLHNPGAWAQAVELQAGQGRLRLVLGAGESHDVLLATGGQQTGLLLQHRSVGWRQVLQRLGLGRGGLVLRRLRYHQAGAD